MLYRTIKIGIGLILIIVILTLMFFLSNIEMKIQTDTPVDHDLSFIGLRDMLLLSEESTKMNIKPGQIIQVSGYVKEVNLLNERITLILKGEQDSSPYMICDFQTDQKDIIHQIKENDKVQVKGVFKGFLKDAIFLNCILTELPPHE
jgi:Cu/Ag efflux protein CusF